MSVRDNDGRVDEGAGARLSGQNNGQSETATTGSLRIIPTGNLKIVQVRVAQGWSTGQFGKEQWRLIYIYEMIDDGPPSYMRRHS